MSETRVRDLDGIRALAISLVVMHHGYGLFPGIAFGWFGILSPGPAGVRLFFVLSGFLITGILVNARTEAERAGVAMRSVCRAFYARRALRIFPLAYLAIAAAFVLGDHSVRSSLGWYVAYLPNVLIAVRNAFGDTVLNHFWSLAVEEQFYLVWPAILLFTPRRVWPWIMGAAIVSSMTLRAVLVGYGWPISAYVLLPSRLDALVVGALFGARLIRPSANAAGVCGALALPCAMVAATSGPAIQGMLGETSGILLSAAFVLSASLGWRYGLSWILRNRVSVWIGTVSYGLYVYHMLIAGGVHLLERRYDVWLRYPIAPGLPRLTWMISTTVLVAAVSWYGFEKPINDLKRFMPYVKRRRVQYTTIPADTRPDVSTAVA